MMKVKSVLFIDDDHITNFLNERLVRKMGVAEELFFASNGEEGLVFIKKCLEEGTPLPDLIFLDINMPVMDGFEFLEAFRKIDPTAMDSITLVMLSTSTHERDIEKLKIYGYDIINKPLTKEQVTAYVSKVLKPVSS